MYTRISDSTVFQLTRMGATALVSLLVAANASAGERLTVKDGVPAIVVKYGDLDISTEAGARALYARLETAAKRVCPDPASRDLSLFEAARACRQQALDRAVGALNSPALAAISSRHAADS
jgi:UrcA family protein